MEFIARQEIVVAQTRLMSVEREMNGFQICLGENV